MPLSKREIEAQRFRASVIARESAAVHLLGRSWKLSVQRLEIQIKAVTDKIEKARREGKTVSRNWLRQQSEYRQLQRNIITEAERYSDKVADTLKQEVSWAARKGAQDAYALAQMSFDVQVAGLIDFRRLPSETVIDIASRVAPNTPTGKVIGKLGRVAAAKSRDVLIAGITEGKNVRVIAADLRKAADIPGNRALTIARTEIFGAYRDTHHASIEENAAILEGWVWMCQLGTACGGCLARHGELLPTDARLTPHPNCHCEPIPKPKSWKDMGFPTEWDALYPDPMQPEAMRAAALEQLKRPEKELAERFGKGKANLIVNDRIELSQLQKQTHSKIWGEATVETPLKELTPKKPH